MRKGFLLSLLCCLGSIASFATTYYYQSGAFNTSTNWTVNADGTGGGAPNFTGGTDVWIVQAAGSITVNAAWTVAGSLQIDGTCTITTNPTITGGITVNSGGILNQNATSTATAPNMAAVQSGTVAYGAGNHTFPAGITFENLTIGAVGNSIASGNITVNATLTINSTEILSMGNFQLLGTLATVTNNGSITTTNTSGTPVPTGINWGSAGVVSYINTTTPQTVAAGTYNSLTLGGASGSITYTASGDITVNGTFTTALAGTTLDMGTNLLSGTMSSVAHNGILKTANTTSTPIPSGKNWNTGAAAIVEYNGTGAQTVVAGNYTNLTISGARGGADITFASGTVKAGNTTNGAFNLTATGVGNYITTGNTFQYGKTNGGMTVYSVIPYNNLTVSNTSLTNTADGDLTIGGALTTTAGGTLDLSTHRIIDGGSFSATNGGTLKVGHIATSAPIPTAKTWTGTVDYNGAGSQTVVAGTYTNLTISGDHLNGDIILESGDVSLAGNFSTLTASNINSYITTGNTVTYRTLAGAQTVAGITYNNLTFLNTSLTNTAAANVTVSGTLTTTAGGTFSLSTFQLLGTPTIVNNGTITTLNTGSSPLPTGLNWGSTGTVSYAATGATTIMAGTYNGLTITGAKGSNNITFEPGTIIINGTPTGSASGVSGFVNTGNTVTFNKSTGALTLFAMPITYNNVTFANTSGTYSVSTAGPMTVNGTLTTTSGGTLYMNTAQLLGAPTIANDGTISTINTGSNPFPSGLDWGNSGTVTYGGTSTATIVTGSYYNLTTTGAHTTNAITLESGIITVDNTLTWGASSSNFVNTGNTLVLNNLSGNGANINSTALTLNNLTLNNTSSSYKAGANLVVNGTLTTTAGGALDMQTFTLTGTLGTIANNGTIRTAATTNPPLAASKDWGTSGTVAFTATTGTQSIPAGTYNNLSLLNTSGTQSAVGTLTVNGVLTVNAGTLSLGTNLMDGTPTSVSNGGIISTSNTTGAPIPSGVNWGTTGTVSFATTTVGSQTVPAGTYNNLTLAQTAATVNATAAGDITVNGTLTTTTGSSYFDLSTHDLIAGTSFAVTNNGTIKTGSTSTTPVPSGRSWSGTTGGFEYNGTGAQTIVAGTYKTLTLSGDHSTADVTLESGTIDVSVSFNNSATNIGNYITTGNTFRYTATAGTQTVGAITYNNLTLLNTSGTNTAGGSITVNGTLTTTAGTGIFSFNNAAHQLLMGGGASANNNGTIQTICTSSPAIAIGKDWSGTGATGKVIYANTTTAQTVSAGTYKHLTVGGASGTVAYTANGNLQVDGTLTTALSTTTLDMAGFAMSGATTPTNNGTILTQNTSSTPLPSGKTWAGIVKYNLDAGGQTVAPGTYSSLYTGGATGGVTNTAGGALSVSTRLDVATGTILDMSTYALSGTLTTIANAGTINTQNTSAAPLTTGKTWSGTVAYNAVGGGQTVMAGTYTNLVTGAASSTGTNTLSGVITVNTTLNNTANYTLSANNAAYQIIGAGMTPTNNGTIQTICTVNPVIPTGKDWSGSGSGSVVYNRAGAQTIAAGTYGNLSVGTGTTAATYTAGSDLTVNGTLSTTSGATLALTTFSLTGTPTTIANSGTISTTSTSATPLPSGVNWGTTGTVSFATTTVGSQTVPAGTYNNLTLAQTAATVNATAAGDITVNGTLTTTTGSSYFDLSTHNLIAGTSFAVANNGTIRTASSSVTPVPSGRSWSGTTGGFEYNGTGAQTIVTGTYKTLTLSGGDRGGATITLQSGTIDLTSNFTVSATNIGGYTNTGNTFRYTTLAGGQTIAGISYNNLTLLNTSATNTAGGDVTIGGTLTTTSGGTMAMAGFQMLGTPTISNAGTITSTNTGTTPFPSNLDWGASGTVSYIGTGATTIVTGTYNNLSISGAHAGTNITLASGNVVVNNLFTCSPTFTLGGTWVNTGNTTVFNNLAGGITLGSVPVIFNNLTFNNTSGTYTAGNDITVNGALTTTAGGTLSFNNVAYELLGSLTSITNNGTISTVCTVNPAIPTGKNWGTTGAVVFARTTGGQSVSGGTYHDLAMSNTSGTQTALAAITVNGTLTTTTGGTLAMTTNQLLGTPTLAHSGLISTTNTGSNPFPSGLDWTTGGGTGTVGYGGTTTATIVTGTYYNLSISGAHTTNSITLASGNITINNTLTNTVTFTSGSWINTGNTTIFNNAAGGLSTGAAAVTYNNLTFNNTSGAYTAGAAITVNGTLTTSGGTLDMSTFALSMGGSSSTSGLGTIKTSNATAAPITASKTWTQTVEFGSAGSQSIVAGNYANLVLSNAGTKTATGAVGVSGDLTIGSSNILADGAQTVTVSGNILGTGTHTGAGKIAMNGASKTISGVTLQNLQLNNAAGFGLTGDVTVNGTLTFTSGIMDLGANNLTFGTAGAAATPSSSSMIVASGAGELRRNFTANGSFTFPIGDNVGPNYTPIAVSLTGGVYGGGAYATAKVTKAAHPQNYSGSDYLNRYWTVNTSNITSPVYTATATYVPGDVVGTESLMYMGVYAASAWTQQAAANTGAHTLSTNANVTTTTADFTGVGGPSVSVNSGTICPGGSVNLIASSPSPFTPITYSWAPNTNLSATTGATVTASPTVTTVYTVTATDSHGLTGTGTATVTVVAQPSVNIGLSSPAGYICPATVMTLTATPSDGTGTANYTWSGPGISGTPSSGAVASYTTIPSASYTTIPPTAAGAYTVVLTYSGSGCSSVSATSSVVTPAVHQWEGGASGDVNNWSNASNWVCGGVPAVSDHILIPNRTNQPTLAASTTSSIARLYVNSGAILTMGASATLNVSGAFTNYGTITGPTTAKAVLNGSSAQSIGGSGNVFNLELNNSAGATIANVAGDSTIVKGTLTLTSGTLTTNGKLMLYADATTNGRIGEITGGAISGNIVTQMWFQTVGHKAWHFFSHPFDNYIAMNMLQNSINMTGSGGSSNGWSDGASNEPSSYWISPGTGWVAFTNANASTSANQFKRHQGIRLFVWGNLGEGIWGGTTSTSVRMRLYGHPNTGTQNVVLSKAASGSAVDYNQVGNPYPSPVNIGQVVKDAFDAGKLVGTTYFVWNPALGTSGQYVNQNIDGSAFYIASGNAFQVRTTTDGNTLIFNESHKGTTPSINLRKYSEGINLTVYDATYHPWDMLSVKFDQESAEGEENIDAGKPEGPADLNFYSISSDNVKLSSDVRPYAAGKVIPLGIGSNVKSQFILKADKVAVPTGARVYLHDKLLNKYQLLKQGAEYPFSINENGMSQGDNRFELTMEELHAFDLHTNVTLEAALSPNPAVSEVAISYTTSGAENTVISVADVSGHILFTKDAGTARNGKVNVPLSQFAAGVYLVTITSGDAKIEKTLIKE